MVIPQTLWYTKGTVGENARAAGDVTLRLRDFPPILQKSKLSLVEKPPRFP